MIDTDLIRALRDALAGWAPLSAADHVLPIIAAADARLGQQAPDIGEQPVAADVLVLPCPFCGAQPIESDIEPHAHGLRIGDWKMPDHPGSHVIECGCGAGMIADTREEALAVWNRRPTPSPAVTCEMRERWREVANPATSWGASMISEIDAILANTK